jgi:hypothetical protein
MELQLACFASATLHQLLSLSEYLQALCDSFSLSALVGVPPYDIPRNLIDPKSVS